MRTSNYRTSPPSRMWGRLLCLLLVLGVLATACGTSDPGSDLAVAAAPTESAQTQSAQTQSAQTQSAEPASTATEPADADNSPAISTSELEQTANVPVADSPAEFEVVIEGEAVFNLDGPINEGGTFVVTTGADELGCEGGTSLETQLRAEVQKLWTCTSGTLAGTIAITFSPPAGTWAVTGASGDFEGLAGEGAWAGVVADDGKSGTDMLTGTMSYGNEVVAAEAAIVDSTPAEVATNDRVEDAIAIDPTALPFTTTVDTTAATSDEDDESIGCDAPRLDASVWYSFSAPVDMRVKVSVEDSNYPAGVVAVAGVPGSFEFIECRPFAFEVAVEANQTYYFLAVDGEDENSQGGTLVFRLEEVARASVDGLAPLGQEYVETVASDVSVTHGAFMMAVVDADDQVVTGHTGSDAEGNAPVGTDVFRIGSITKVFTALATLTLVEEGLVDLDADAVDYVTRVPVPQNVTVRDLLQHTTGIFNVTDGETFFPTIFGDPERFWSPEEMVELIVDEEPLFEPGSEFSYSNTNYTILGVLIEEVTGEAYHEAVRNRLLEPIGLTSTYLAGYEDGPALFHPYEHEGNEDYDYTSIETGAWAAGAMVSSAADLHRLFVALFDGRIVSDQLVSDMIDGDEYGFGLELNYSDDGLYGHGGGIPGYGTFVRHSPELGMTAFYVSTDQTADPSFAEEKLLEGFALLASE